MYLNSKFLHLHFALTCHNLELLNSGKGRIFMSKPINILLRALLLLSLLPACQTLPLSGKLPDGLGAEKITSVDKGSPFALSPDGNLVAIVSSGLKMFHLPTKEYLSLGDKSPYKLAWSPFGNSLAALFAKGEGSSIVIYDQHGIPFAESEVDARLTDLEWLSEAELLAGGVRFKSYRFGSSYQSFYLRWLPGRDLPTENRLRDTTLQPATIARWKTHLERGPMLALSAQSGTLLYLHPVDPPMFTPYYKLIMKDLANGKELELASLGFESGGGKFSADGERILYGDGKGATLLYNPWSEELFREAATAGRDLSLSPEGETWASDGALFRAGAAVTPLAEGAVVQFSADGSRAVVSAGGDLYLLSGLKTADGVMFVPAVAEKISRLRSMRLQGQVTPQEYQENLLRIRAQ